jgi:hypothetical protein
MKGLYYALLITSISLLTLNCQKEYRFEVDNPVQGNIPSPITATVQGNIVDENGQPASDVEIKVGNKSVLSDAKGFFRINNAALDKNAAMVTAQKSGYFKAFRTFSATNSVNYIKIKLIQKTSAGTINAASGGSVTLPNGSSIALPANGVVKASGSTAFAGDVLVYAAYIDPTQEDISQTVPGSFMATDKNDKRVVLTSYGMMAVELESNSGEKLQIASGSKATLTAPIPSSILSSAPATIPLWYVDEATGVWKEEGTATKNGNNYVGEVTHFSFWNYDISANAVMLTLTIKDNEGVPFTHALVQLSLQNGWSGSTGGYTDSSGTVSGWVPDNVSMLLEVLDPCNNAVYSQVIGPFNQNANLGVITVSISNAASLLTIKGKLKNCSNAVVTNGYALINFENVSRYVSVNNAGEFSMSMVRCPAGTGTAEIIAVDETTQQQSAVHTIAVAATGTTNAGEISACGVASNQFINYTIDGSPFSIVSTSATDSITAYTYLAQTIPEFATWVSAWDIGTNDNIAFTFRHDAAIGTYAVSNFSAQSFDSLEIVAPFNVVLTKYPAVIGEFFEGTFSGKFKESSAPIPVHNINGNFRLRRMN